MGSVPRGRKVRKRLCYTNEKLQNFLCLVYLEDLEKAGCTFGDLLRYLDSLHVQVVISPIHDRDCFTADDVWSWCEERIDPDTGDLDLAYIHEAPYVGKPKKPHVHLYFHSETRCTAMDMNDLMDGLFPMRPTIWERCLSKSGSIRYFAHMDSPEKAQYSPYEIIALGGVKLDAVLVDESKTKMIEITNVIIDVIQNCKVYYFYELVNYVRKMEDPEAEACLFGKYALFNCIVRSRRDSKVDAAMAKKRKKEAEHATHAGDN